MTTRLLSGLLVCCLTGAASFTAAPATANTWTRIDLPQGKAPPPAPHLHRLAGASMALRMNSRSRGELELRSMPIT